MSMPDKYRAAAVEKLAAAMSFVGNMIGYLTRNSKSSGLEIKFLNHVQNLLTAYHEYILKNKGEAYLRAIYERERREFFMSRADKMRDRNAPMTTQTAAVQKRIQELFDVKATAAQCSKLLDLAESEEEAMSFLDWVAANLDNLTSGKPIYSARFLISVWPRYLAEKPDDSELRLLEARAARANKNLSTAR